MGLLSRTLRNLAGGGLGFFCPGCHEIVEGPFEQCWNCGRLRPL